MHVLQDEFLRFFDCAQKCNARYLLIGAFAVNYYGYNRNTDDMDVWLAPTNENRQAFINTLLCMNYSEAETAPLQNVDFASYFVGNFGSDGSRINVLTILHQPISFYKAEETKQIFQIKEGVFMNIISYDILKEIKLGSKNQKDLYDVDRIELLRNLKNNQ